MTTGSMPHGATTAKRTKLSSSTPWKTCSHRSWPMRSIAARFPAPQVFATATRELEATRGRQKSPKGKKMTKPLARTAMTVAVSSTTVNRRIHVRIKSTALVQSNQYNSNKLLQYRSIHQIRSREEGLGLSISAGSTTARGLHLPDVIHPDRYSSLRPYRPSHRSAPLHSAPPHATYS